MKNLKGKVVALTGAASGIGRCLAIQLSDLGCHLALADCVANEHYKSEYACC
jgi:NAD(P)-dependent dehydrogenase (short-subunit alcohol dehydrogenase family)